ncbi:olfactory receptor 6N2-like [Pelodytes ibericus]
MEKVNQSLFRDFMLQGFSDLEEYRIYLFVLFLIIYLLTIFGNVVIILVVRFNANLHTPMYFFITALSCLELWYVSTTVPKLLSVLLTNNKRISFGWCFAQLYMFHSLGITEVSMLAIMSFDRCMAVYNPLRYTTIMSDRIKTNEGRSKAFVTCSSHLTVVVLFYSTAFIVYIVPKEKHSVEHDKIYALFYTMLTPLLNPVIYSLRNKERNVPLLVQSVVTRTNRLTVWTPGFMQVKPAGR